MENNNKFWAYIWTVGLASLLWLFTLMAINAFDRRAKWSEAVSNGADPMVTACAIFDSNSSAEHVICSMLAQNRK